ncbi:MAG: putative domain HDIG-containing protein [Eubacterium sp.]|nr:putative domain HDIG-containing protein [Eubacterium sp.]
MDLVNNILKHPKFIEYIGLNKAREVERIFCHHNLQHALDVARVAYIIALENRYDLSKEIIYAAALLHDIAKWKQYKEKVDHASEGAVLAGEILEDLNTNIEDTEMILDAIRSHRIKGRGTSTLSIVLYAGDKSCRPCIDCNMVKECDWYIDGKEPELLY